MENILTQLEIVEKKWQTAIREGNKPQMTKYCNLSCELKKQIYPVVLTIETARNLMGENTNEKYGLINFSNANNGWYSSKIFHKTQMGKNVLNEIGEQFNIKFSRGNGSAFLEFNPKYINEVASEIKKHGFLCEIQ